MIGGDEWGPWIEHDGATLPPRTPTYCPVQIMFGGPGIRPAPMSDVSGNWPGFFWRWKKVRTGWFSSELKRVCDDPEYAPIIRYRIRKPRGLIILQSLLENLPEQVDA